MDTRFASKMSKTQSTIAAAMAKKIKDVIYEYSGTVPLVLALGVLRVVEKEFIDAAEMEDITPGEPNCSRHPDAPHGFDRNGSHNAGRYVCQCEGWKP